MEHLLCCMCYPGVGDDNIYCQQHFDVERRRINEIDPASPLHAVVRRVGDVVIPHRHRHADPSLLVEPLVNVDPLRTGVVLHGESDLGKSFQAACLMRRAVEYSAVHGTPVAGEFVWTTTLGLIEMLIGEFGKSPKVSVTQRLIDARLLVLDDIGTSRLIDDRKSDWAYGKLLDVVNSRYDAMRPIIVTSNLAPGPLGAQVGERIVGRLMHGSVVVHLKGEPRRLPAGISEAVAS